MVYPISQRGIKPEGPEKNIIPLRSDSAQKKADVAPVVDAALHLSGAESKQTVCTVLDILIQLMKEYGAFAIANQIIVSYLTDSQRSLADLQARAFFYLAGTPRKDPHFSPDLWDTEVPDPTPENIGTFGLGYGNITVGEIMESLRREVTSLPPGSSFPPANSSWQYAVHSRPTTESYTALDENRQTKTVSTTANRSLVFSATHNEDGTYSIHVKSHIEAMSGSGANAQVGDTFDKTFTKTFSSEKEFMGQAQNVFQEAYKETVDWAKERNLDLKFMIPYEEHSLYTYTGPDQELQLLSRKSAQIRAEHNAFLDTLFGAIRQRIEVFSDKANTQQKLSESIEAGRKQMDEMFTAIIKQFNSLVARITGN